MKVLLVTPEFPPISIGGGGVVYENLSKQLQLEGHQVTVLAGNFSNKKLVGKVESVPVNDFHVNFVPLLPFPRTSKYDSASYTFPTVSGTLHLIKEIVQSKNEVIHLHGYCHPMINMTALFCVFSRKKYVLTCHGIPKSPDASGVAFRSIFKFYLNTVVKLMVRSAKAVTVISNSLLAECASKNLTHPKTIVIPNGANTALAKTKPESLEKLEKRFSLGNRKVIFAIGRLNATKGFQFLVEAMPQVISKVPDALAVIAGSGAYGSVLRDLICTKGLSNNVKLIGKINEETKAAFYERSEVVVFPSLQEPFGIVLLEALSLHKPIVAFDTSFVREIVGLDSALLAQAGSAESLSQAIVNIITNSQLKDRLIANSNNSKIFTWEAIANQYVRAYR